ncbi:MULTISPECIES: TPM domain-containing protein [Segatella]|uniref:Beta-propeller domain of methanol dehydrogenase type protein n=2 Tax=Segatella TaxID=2974251 RepID=D8DW20_9BACT|nr:MULTISPECIES: TPM domain-containing protein [Segatella]MEE3416137.1 TPM domain-containing protein [Prevotella sp.]EFI72355.1 beta-propeller domain of methanol dehydrogenase type protein [Segatella baroniae B14]UKK72477.1 TPM domain-containing protein [Segatella bryantii]UKK79586.1 TPM domain-containing protein [Segatella baroniae B14]SER10944.1 uncharacterized protein SAMN05444375_1276 [Segatella baroniae B14]
MKIKSALLTLMVLLATIGTFAQIPDKPNPPKLVNDFAGILPDANIMEDSLEEFARKTSNQIVVVTINDLEGLDKADFAQQLGQKWGVGGKKYNNGIVILIKAKNETKGEAFIATGYGMEGALPDAVCYKVVNHEMIPHFKENNYSEGVWAALHILMPIAKGEIDVNNYAEDADDDTFIGIVFIFVLIFLFILYCFFGDKHSGGKGGSATFGGFGGGFYHGSSGGSSGFGGFGGFGGGSFGGGGAGGSW